MTEFTKEALSRPLSFSAIKEFSESPSHFYRYRTGEKKTTDAMKMGSLVHLLILEPDKFDEKYVIFQYPEPSRSANLKANKEAKQQALLDCEEKGKELITEAQYNEAKSLADLVTKNDVAKKLLNKCFDFECPVNWKFDDLDWCGFIDARGFNIIVDIKKCRDAHPEKIRWESRRNKWHWQGYLYSLSINPMNPFAVKFYNICVDNSGGVSVNQISWSLMNLAKSELLEKTEQFRQCCLSELWDSNYEYFSSDGVYLVE